MFATSLFSIADTQRFPQPDFRSGYQMPETLLPSVVSWGPEEVNVVVLVLALVLAAWAVLKVRSRRLVQGLALACLLWFGFWRRGCLCPIGAVQSVVAALAGQPGLTLAAAMLFVLPLMAALLFGRVFCAAVCPQGAMQDLLVVRPVRVPVALDALLRFGRWLFLALALLYAATESGWLLCRFDPYIVFFRRAGLPVTVFAGVAMLVLGAFVVRPYCRYLCPYGLMLGALSRIAWRTPVVTPEECIRCRLCEQSCPVNAIEPPESPPESPSERAVARRRFQRVIGLLVPVVLAGAAVGWGVAPRFAARHPDGVRVAVARQAERGETHAPGSHAADVLEALEIEGRTVPALAQRADETTRLFRFWTALAGGVLMLGVMLQCVHLARIRHSPYYDLDPVDCVGCARCFGVCPLNRKGKG